MDIDYIFATRRKDNYMVKGGGFVGGHSQREEVLNYQNNEGLAA
jgi:hypothetical protein